MSPLARIITAVFLVAAPLCVPAQNTVAASTSIDRITFVGGDPYTDAELRRAISLHTGDQVTEPMISSAAKALTDTGLFADVSADLDFADGVHTLTFKLKPVPDDQLLRVSFANIIWLSNEEIEAAIRRAVPLFHDRVTGEGTTVDRIQAVITDLLVKRQYKATLEHSIVAANPDHPWRAVEFRVIDPPIRLLSADIGGGPVALLNAEVAAQKRALAAPYNQGTAGVTTDDILLGPLRDAGYLDARIINAKIERSTMANGVGILYSGRIFSGPQYKVGNVVWAPTAVYTQDDFARDNELHPGTLPRDSALVATRTAILNAFHKNGYVEADLRVSRELDDQQGLVNYTFSVNPGPAYHVSKVSTTGLSAPAQAEFDANFALKPGSPFDALYVDNFLVNHPSLKALSGYEYSYQTITHPESHELELTLNFVPAK
jgi:outer membrane protein insertion porin family